MRLSDWISAEGGRRAVARKLEVAPETIHYWLRGGVTPRGEMMQKIVDLSKGKVSFEEIIRETKPQLKKKRGRK